eukprot:Nk52_evm14s311 gene=Nk52_evmTU14s311
MGEYTAHMNLNQHLERPSFFELVAQDSMMSVIRPAVKHLLLVLAHVKPEIFGNYLKYEDEIYASFAWYLQWHYCCALYAQWSTLKVIQKCNPNLNHCDDGEHFPKKGNMILGDVYVGEDDDIDIDIDGFVEEEDYDASIEDGESFGAPTSNSADTGKSFLTKVEENIVRFITNFKAEDYPMELGSIAFILLYVVLFFYGSKANTEVAKAWAQTHVDLFTSQFALLGDNAGHLLVKESEYEYVFWASGRRYCQYLVSNIVSMKRHDLVSCLLSVLFPSYDRVCTRVKMNSDCGENFVLAVVLKKNEKQFKEDHQEFTYYAKTYRPDFIPDNFVVLTDAYEVVEEIFTDEVCDVLENNQKYLESIIYTDQDFGKVKLETVEPPEVFKRTLYFDMKLPPPGKMDEIFEMTEVCVKLIDSLSEITLSGQGKSKCDKLRADAFKLMMKNVHLKRQEEAQERKVQKKLKEKEAVDSLTPEQQRKWEEKEYKKSLKKKMKSGKVVM